MLEVDGVKASTASDLMNVLPCCMRLHCGDVQKPKKNQTGYWRLKTEPNRTKFEKSEPNQPYKARINNRKKTR